MASLKPPPRLRPSEPSSRCYGDLASKSRGWIYGRRRGSGPSRRSHAQPGPKPRSAPPPPRVERSARSEPVSLPPCPCGTCEGGVEEGEAGRARRGGPPLESSARSEPARSENRSASHHSDAGEPVSVCEPLRIESSGPIRVRLARLSTGDSAIGDRSWVFLSRAFLSRALARTGRRRAAARRPPSIRQRLGARPAPPRPHSWPGSG